MRLTRLILTQAVAVALMPIASAIISTGNFSIAGNTMSFDLTGSIDAGANVGPSSQGNLYIGVPNVSGWVLSSGDVLGGEINIVNNGGGDLKTTSGGYSPTGSQNLGDFIYLSKNSGLWAPGDSVNASITITGTGSQLNLGNLNEYQMIVSAGKSSGLGSANGPNVTYQVGQAIPEPSTYALVLALLSLGLLFTRKLKWL